MCIEKFGMTTVCVSSPNQKANPLGGPWGKKDEEGPDSRTIVVCVLWRDERDGAGVRQIVPTSHIRNITTARLSQ